MSTARGTARHTARRTLPLAPHEAFDLVTDVSDHGRWIPLTRVQGPSGPARLGARYSALSAGLLRDRMEVAELTPPADDDGAATATLVKRGPLLLGSATIMVSAGADGPGVGCGPDADVAWGYDMWLAGLPPRLTRWPVSALGRAMAALALARMARAVR